MPNKYSYFQGGGGENEPKPKKQQYHPDKAILVQQRFVEPFYRNFDAYNVEGVDGPPKLGPGSGWHQIMENYKSISDFLADKRKHMKNKYKADDFWIEDTLSNRNERISKMKTRTSIFNRLIKMAIDFPIDDQIKSTPILGDAGSYSDSVPIGGMMDEYLTEPDLEGKTPDKLNFGRDYEEDGKEPKEKLDIDSVIEKYLNPTDRPFGLPDGIEQEEDLTQPNKPNSQYGTTDSGNTQYENLVY